METASNHEQQRFDKLAHELCLQMLASVIGWFVLVGAGVQKKCQASYIVLAIAMGTSLVYVLAAAWFFLKSQREESSSVHSSGSGGSGGLSEGR